MTARTLLAPFSGLRSGRRSWSLDPRRAWRVIVTRRDLAEAEPRMLRDVGLSQADALRELRRAPWDAEPRPPHRRRPQRSAASQITAFREWVKAAWRRHRSRQLLARMDAAALRDIGLTYAEAEAEANKPFWRD